MIPTSPRIGPARPLPFTQDQLIYYWMWLLLILLLVYVVWSFFRWLRGVWKDVRSTRRGAGLSKLPPPASYPGARPESVACNGWHPDSQARPRSS